MAALLHQLLGHVNQRRIRALQVGGSSARMQYPSGFPKNVSKHWKRLWSYTAQTRNQVLTSFHTSCATTQECSFWRCIENPNLMSLKREIGRNGISSTRRTFFWFNAQLGNKRTVCLVLASVPLKKLSAT